MTELLIDSKVSEIKFNREVENLLSLQSILRKQGWIIESTIFPIVRVSFIATKIFPPIIPLTVDVDFTNYNIWAPSVRFLNSVTFEPIYLPGLRKAAEGDIGNIIITGHPTTGEPFICLPGVREYHNHPEHNGNSWDLCRYTGEGSLYFLLEKIWTYCIKSINAFYIQIQAQAQQVGIHQEATDE